MTDRDPDTGQYTSDLGSNPNGVPVSTDYVPYDDGSSSEPAEELSLDDARDLIMKWDAEDLARNQHINGGDHPITLDDLPDNVTFTEEQAEKGLLDVEAARGADAQQKEDDRFRAEIDALRAENQPPAEQPADPLKALEEPLVKQAIEKATADAQQAETARAEHINGLAAATQIAEASFFAQFPEFSGVPPEQRLQVFAQIQQSDPAKANLIQARVHEVAGHLQRYQAESGRLAAEHQTKMQAYAKAESEKFEESIRDVPQAERAEIEKAIVGAIDKAGGSNEAFANLMRSSEFASSAVQSMLWDYGKLLVSESRRASVPMPRPVRNVPTVMKPGTASGKSASEISLEAADRRLSQSGSEEDAWNYLQAKMRARG